MSQLPPTEPPFHRVARPYWPELEHQRQSWNTNARYKHNIENDDLASKRPPQPAPLLHDKGGQTPPVQFTILPTTLTPIPQTTARRPPRHQDPPQDNLHPPLLRPSPPLTPVQRAEFDNFLTGITTELLDRVGIIAAREEAEKAAIESLEKQIKADAKYRASVAVFAKTGSRDWFKRRCVKKKILGEIYHGLENGGSRREGVDPRVREVEGR
ncbi:hypothetical protein QBC41DRAFT_308496 [Cercophora samala]|uniref:Uncharacterized protein n=1 Tax=Cercophora samala TaxID=330535 RepID=A0AA39YJ60_9PEZI|nr:hypothetical protein QBC41DRAFT_308496 [Cercophora samala]